MALQIRTSIHGKRLGLAADGSLVLNKPGGVQEVFGSAKVVTITVAQMLALFTTPITIVPAPGAGVALRVKYWEARHAAGVAYAGIAAGEDLVLKYTDAAGAEISQQIETTGFLDQTTAQIRVANGLNTVLTPLANAAVVLHLLSGNITTGDMPLIVRVEYEIIPTSYGA